MRRARPAKNAMLLTVLQRGLTVASHLSITSGRLIGLEVDETAFQFFEYRDGEWETPDDRALASASFPAGIAVEITVSEETAKNVEKDDRDEGDREEDEPFPSVLFCAHRRRHCFKRHIHHKARFADCESVGHG